MEKQYVVYDSLSGKILRAGRCEDEDLEQQAGAGEAIVEGAADLWSDYVISGAIQPRPACPVTVDGMTLRGVPAPCKILIGDESFDCLTDSARLALPPGRHYVAVSAWPYLEPSLVVVSDGSVDAGEGQIITPTPAAPTVPASVTMRQARLALLRAGMLSSVSAAISAMPGDEGEAARIEWEYAATVERSSALIAGLIPALGMTVEQIDQLFILAATL